MAVTKSAAFQLRDARLLATQLPSSVPAGLGVGKTLTAVANGALTVDGMAVAVNDRIAVVKYGGAWTSLHTGIYSVTAIGSAGAPWVLTRAQDFDGAVRPGSYFAVREGVAHGDEMWRLDTPSPVVDVTPLKFCEFGADSLIRGNWETVTGDNGVKTATFNGAPQVNPGSRGAYILIRLGTVSGTTPTLSCQLQMSPNGGQNWLNIGAALANLTATNNTGLIVVNPSLLTGLTSSGTTAILLVAAPMPRTWRIVFTINGTTPSFAIAGVNVSYVG